MKHFFIFLVIFAANLFLPQIVTADVTTLVPTDCFVDDLTDTSCLSAINANGGTSTTFSKGSHLDVPLQTLSASSITSTTLHFDSWATLSGSWGIYLKDARDGSTICSIDPAPEDGSETSNSASCTLTTTQLNNGTWIQANNNDDKGPQSVNLDRVYLSVDYTPLPAVSISLATDGTISFGTLAENTTQDTTAGGINDVETITVDTGPADLDVRSTTFFDGSNTWALGNSSGNNQVHYEFSPDSSAWTSFSLADTLYTLATNVSQSSAQNLYLRLTTPTSTSSFLQHSTTVVIVASSP